MYDGAAVVVVVVAGALTETLLDPAAVLPAVFVAVTTHLIVYKNPLIFANDVGGV